MLTKNHLFHAVFFGDGGLYLEVSVTDNNVFKSGPRYQSRVVGLHLSTWCMGLWANENLELDYINCRLRRNERYEINGAFNRMALIGVAEGLVKSIEQDYGFQFLRGDNAGYLRQAALAHGEYMKAAFDKLPYNLELFRALETWYRRRLARKA